MAENCCLSYCPNRHKNSIGLDLDLDITFHRFPNNEGQRKKWREVVRLWLQQEWWEPSNTSALCSNHFEDFDWAFQDSNSQSKRRLKASVVPSVYSRQETNYCPPKTNQQCTFNVTTVRNWKPATVPSPCRPPRLLLPRTDEITTECSLNDVPISDANYLATFAQRNEIQPNMRHSSQKTDEKLWHTIEPEVKIETGEPSVQVETAVVVESTPNLQVIDSKGIIPFLPSNVHQMHPLLHALGEQQPIELNVEGSNQSATAIEVTQQQNEEVNSSCQRKGVNERRYHLGDLPETSNDSPQVQEARKSIKIKNSELKTKRTKVKRLNQRISKLRYWIRKLQVNCKCHPLLEDSDASDSEEINRSKVEEPVRLSENYTKESIPEGQSSDFVFADNVIDEHRNFGNSPGSIKVEALNNDVVLESFSSLDSKIIRGADVLPLDEGLKTNDYNINSSLDIKDAVNSVNLTRNSKPDVISLERIGSVNVNLAPNDDTPGLELSSDSVDHLAMDVEESEVEIAEQNRPKKKCYKDLTECSSCKCLLANKVLQEHQRFCSARMKPTDEGSTILQPEDSKPLVKRANKTAIDIDALGTALGIKRRSWKVLPKHQLEDDASKNNPLTFRYKCKRVSEGYECTLCQEISKDKPKFFYHIKHCCPFPHFICQICNIDYRTGVKLREHLKYHDTSKDYVCETCGMAFGSRWTLIGHLRLHSDEKPFKCSECDFAFKRGDYLRYHEKTHHNKIPKTDESKLKYMCEFCSRRFSNERLLKIHWNLHYDDAKFFCEKCGKAHTTEMGLKRHLTRKICENVSKQQNEEDKRETARKYAREWHQRHKNDPGKFQCEICSKLFRHQSLLKAHYDSHSTGKEYQCHLCSKKFKLKSSLKRHVILHSGPKLSCEYCERRFLYLSEWRVHLLSHSKIRQFVCACGKSFKYKSDLSSHVKRCDELFVKDGTGGARNNLLISRPQKKC